MGRWGYGFIRCAKLLYSYKVAILSLKQQNNVKTFFWILLKQACYVMRGFKMMQVSNVLLVAKNY